MSSTIIELSRITSDDKISNSTWKNSLKSGIIIEEGDQVLLKNAYIDTTNLSSNNFIFNEDITCKIDFGFYLLCTGIEQVALSGKSGTSTNTFFNINNITVPDGLPYVCINENPQDPNFGKPYLDYVEFTIPAGTYSKTFLSQFMSRKLQSLNVVANEYWPGVWSNYPQDPASNPPPPYPVIESVYQQLYLQNIPRTNFYECSVGIPPILNVVISPAHCDIAFYPFLQNLPPQVNYLYSAIFQKCQAVGYDFDGGYMGCPNMSISFNNDSQKYQFDYLHTSITDNNQNELTGIAYQAIAGKNEKLIFINQRGGLMLTGLSPPSFWSDIMGFDLNNILFDPTLNNISYNDFFNKTTQNFPAISQLIKTGTNVTVGGYSIQSAGTIITPPTDYKFTQSTATDPIIAKNQSIGTIISAGHYLIDIKGYNTNYKNAFGDTQYKGLVSAFFLSVDSFLSAPSPDSSFYIHHGSPQTLNSFEVAIIDPLTHKPALNIGENSSVYIQVIKNKKEVDND